MNTITNSYQELEALGNDVRKARITWVNQFYENTHKAMIDSLSICKFEELNKTVKDIKATYEPHLAKWEAVYLDEKLIGASSWNIINEINKLEDTIPTTFQAEKAKIQKVISEYNTILNLTGDSECDFKTKEIIVSVKATISNFSKIKTVAELDEAKKEVAEIITKKGLYLPELLTKAYQENFTRINYEHTILGRVSKAIFG